MRKRTGGLRDGGTSALSASAVAAARLGSQGTPALLRAAFKRARSWRGQVRCAALREAGEGARKGVWLFGAPRHRPPYPVRRNGVESR